jgi:hypothetical protein
MKMDIDMDTVDIHMDISLDIDMIIVMRTGNEHGSGYTQMFEYF